MYSFGCVQTQGSDSSTAGALTVATNHSEGLLLHCLESSQPCAAGLDWLKGLCYVVLQERQDPFETSDCHLSASLK